MIDGSRTGAYTPRMKKISVALVGSGAMGGALLRGWISAGVIEPRESAVFDPVPAPGLRDLARDSSLAFNPPAAPLKLDAIVFAVKPQGVHVVLPPYRGAACRTLAVSVMAGVSLERLGSLLESSRLVRAMPNLPAQIGEGVSGLFAPPHVEADDRRVAEMLLAAVGETVWVRSEEEIDAVTAISGSGPAYYFLLTEALAEAGVSIGLEPEAAAKLARATAKGAGALLASDARGVSELRRAVTSRGGTTEAALGVLDGADHALRALMERAATAAARRASELSD